MYLCLLVAAKDEYEYVVHWRISMILPGGGRAKIDIPVSIGCYNIGREMREDRHTVCVDFHVLFRSVENIGVDDISCSICLAPRFTLKG